MHPTPSPRPAVFRRKRGSMIDTTRCVVWLLTLFAYFASTQARAEDAATIQRFALIVGANDGGDERVQLRFANSDAKAVAKVLAELGGVQADDVVVALQPTTASLRRALEQLSARVANVDGLGARTQFVFYYSGHSDEQGLMLGDEEMPYADLRKLIDQVPADVRIGILDSCASGAFTRSKGGRRVAPFLVSGGDVTGHAFLTSSSMDEAAQESDRIRGSFFTHFLVSGLRGAADQDRDRRITLDEAYQFAFAETLARTSSSKAGPQHANYDIQLTGMGELIVTDLRRTTAGLAIAPDVSGRIYVRTASGDLAGELFKPAGSGAIELALEPGTYSVIVENDGKLTRGQAVLVDGRTTQLTMAHLNPFRGDANTLRGGSGDTRPYHRIPVTMSLFPPLSVNSVVRDRRVVNNFAINWISGHASQIRGLELGLGANWVDEDVRGGQLAIGANLIGTELRGVQWAVGGNLARGGLRGLQASVATNVASTERAIDPERPLAGAQLTVGANVARGNFNGLQFDVGANVVTGHLHGAQANVGFNYARAVAGAQLSVGANVASQGVAGIQWSVGFNVARRALRGVQMAVGTNVTSGTAIDERPRATAGQLAVGVNVARRNFRGLQLDAAINVVGGELRGVQLNSGFNYAGSVAGVQLGLINISPGRVRGAQVGLINYADDADASVAIIGITRKNGVGGDVWTDDIGVLNTGLRLRTRHTYTLLFAEVHPFSEASGGHWGVGAFFGGHIDIRPRLYLDIDVGHRFIFPGFDEVDADAIHSVFTVPRILLGLRVGRYLSLFAGPSFNMSIADSESVRPGYQYDVYHRDYGETEIRLWPGFTFGLRIR